MAQADGVKLAPFALVYLKASSGKAATPLRDPCIHMMAGKAFIEGVFCVPGSHWLNGRRNWLALDEVASFFEFSSEEDHAQAIAEHRQPGGPFRG